MRTIGGGTKRSRPLTSAKRWLRLFLVLVVAAVLAPPAAAQAPPTVGGPADGATFTQGDPIAFTAYDDTPTAHVYVHISTSTTPDSVGVIGWDVWFGELSGGPSWSKTWTGSGTKPPGTYYWQIYRTDDVPCFYLSDCYHKADVRSFTINAAPPPPADAPTLVSPAVGQTFYAGAPIGFSVTDPSAGANVRINISSAGTTDSSGVIAEDVWSAAMTGGPTFTAQWFQPSTQAPGTYYWQVYRTDAADPDGKVPSVVRSFKLAAPSAAAPSLLAPADGATITAGDRVMFTVRGAAGQSMWVQVSKSPATDAEGLIGYEMGLQSMTGGPDFTADWRRAAPAGPGTYYWQAHRIDCFTPSYPDCEIESSIRSFRLVAAPPVTYPAPTPLAPLAGARVRIGRRITFRVRDEAPGARVRVLISDSSRKGSDGLIFGDHTDVLQGGPEYSLTWKDWADVNGPGDYYWQPYRDECERFNDTGCEVGGAVRRIRLLPSSARIAVPPRCYREGARIPVTGRGFTPRRLVDVQFLGHKKVTKRTDGRGRFSARVLVPNMPDYPDWGRDRLWAYERGNDGNEPTKSVRVVAIAMSVPQAGLVRRGQKTRFIFSGFPNRRYIYGHYLLGGRVRGTQQLGRTRAPCGTLTTRAELIPSRIERSGIWTAQYDARKTYSKRTRPRLRRRISVLSFPASATWAR